MQRMVKTPRQRPAGQIEIANPRGRLLLVVDGHNGEPATIVSAVRRRCADMAGLEFVRCVTTRPDGTPDAEQAMSRRAFRDVERTEGFFATWNVRGHWFGLPASLRDLLRAGRIVVVAAPASIVPDVRAQWLDVRIIRVMAEIDAARSPLEPRLCLARMLGAKVTAQGPVRRGLNVDASITCANNAPAAVRLLTDAVLRLGGHQPGGFSGRATTAHPRGRSVGAASRGNLCELEQSTSQMRRKRATLSIP
jgi:ribose 1,5-bisphosphokinase PhnN